MLNKNTPSNSFKLSGDTVTPMKPRSSNLELYRIFLMLLIVAHHMVGPNLVYGPMTENPYVPNTWFLWLISVWGKTGINCFIMITGYFMCKSHITIKKFIKLCFEIYLYRIGIFIIFLGCGYESLSFFRIVKLLSPIWGINSNFTSCFLVFYITIPFWNKLIHNISKKQHLFLLLLFISVYSIGGSVPKFSVTVNYVSWFGIIYLIASFLRLYPNKLTEKKYLWLALSVFFVILGVFSVIILHKYVGRREDFLLSDSNKILALSISISSFLYFKNLKIQNSKLINLIGGSTFSVLLIHASSDAMRTWLWKDTVDVVGHFYLPFEQLVVFSIGVVLLIFFTCIIIDRIRIELVEKPFFQWYDKKPRFQKFVIFFTES